MNVFELQCGVHNYLLATFTLPYVNEWSYRKEKKIKNKMSSLRNVSNATNVDWTHTCTWLNGAFFQNFFLFSSLFGGICRWNITSLFVHTKHWLKIQKIRFENMQCACRRNSWKQSTLMIDTPATIYCWFVSQSIILWQFDITRYYSVLYNQFLFVCVGQQTINATP